MPELTPANAERMMRRLARNASFAGQQAINKTLDTMQQAVRRHMGEAFTLRAQSNTLFPRMVKTTRVKFIKGGPRQAVEDMVGELYIQGPERRGDYLDQMILKHQQGDATPRDNYLDMKDLARGSGNAPYFFRGRMFKASGAPRSMYPTALGLVPMRDAKADEFYYALGKNSKRKGLTPFKLTSQHKTRIEGKGNTFMLNPLFNRSKYTYPIIFQRIGKQLNVLWVFGGRRVLKPRFKGIAIARHIRDTQLLTTFAAEFRKAMS